MDKQLLRYDKEKTLVFIDCETFNLCLNSCHNLPWQIAMIKVQGDKRVAKKNFYIKWDTHLKIGKEAARITRYSQKVMDEKGLPPEEVFPTIMDWLDDADYIVGHNVLGFDLYLLKDYYEYMNFDYSHLTEKVIDTMCLARGVKTDNLYKPDINFLAYQYVLLHTKAKGLKASLVYLGKEMDIKHDYANLHDALVDLELNVKVWNKLKWLAEI